MSSIIEYRHFLLREKHAEREGCKVIVGENHTQSLELLRYRTEIEVPNKKGDMVTIRAQDIFKAAKKFCAEVYPDDSHCILTDVANVRASECATWLRAKPTSNYQFIREEDDVLWLENISLMAVIRIYMENKDATGNFADEYAAEHMKDILMIRAFARDIAKAVNHSIKDGVDALELIRSACEMHMELIAERRRKIAEPLPSLPYGTPAPLVIPSELKSKGHA